MSEMKRIFGDRTVNNMVVAIILGIATWSFVSNVVSPIFANLFNTSDVSWRFRDFLFDLFVYAVMVLVAWWVGTMADK